MNENFIELLELNLSIHDMLAEEEAANYPEEMLALYAFGTLGGALTERLDNELAKNRYLADRMTDMRNYINFYELGSIEAYQQQLLQDQQELALAKARENDAAPSEDVVTKQVSDYFQENKGLDPLVIHQWVLYGPVGLA